MLIEVTDIELEVIRRALRAAIDLGDTFYTFCPETSCGGAKVYYANGTLEDDEAMRRIGIRLWKKVYKITHPITIEQKQLLLREMRREMAAEKKVSVENQMDMEFDY